MNSPDLQLEYARYNRNVRLSNIKIGLLLEIILFPTGALLDWLVYPRYVMPFLGLRIGCSIATTLVLVLLLGRWKDRLYPVLIHAWYVLPTLTMGAMIAISEGASSPYYAGLNLVLLGASVVMQTSMIESLIITATIFLFYWISCYINPKAMEAATTFNNFYFMTCTALIVLAGNYNYNRLRRQEFMLRHELGESRRQLETSNNQLRMLDEAKSRFFANISHELRTPLTLIAGPIEKLRLHSTITNDSELSKLMSIMESNSLRLLKMINNLLELVRSDGRTNDSEKRVVSIDSALNGLITSVEHLAQQKGIRLNKTFEPSTRPVLIDMDKLEKIVLNLLLNALKFTPAGGSISIDWMVADNSLKIEIQDTGIGIAEEDLKNIFDRFWQANTSSTRKFQGVGIGLALVRELTVAMKGQVSVQSNLGQGTSFSIVIPVEAANDAQLSQSTVAPDQAESPKLQDDWLASLYRRADLFIEKEVSSPEISVTNLVKRKRPLILIGEDQPDMAEFVAAQLKDDFDVLIATDGQYAIDLTRQYQPDLVVLDMMMPEKDGLEVCRELRDIIEARGLPILILTAKADEETKLTVLQNGATDFLTKPFSTTELQVRCKNLLGLALLRNQLADKNTKLSQSLEQLTESEVRMVQHAKMISLGRMSAGLIHEINNPLNFVNAALRTLRKKMDSSSASESLTDIFNDIEHGLKRVSDLVSNMRTFSHPNPDQLETINLRDCICLACRLTSGDTEASSSITVNVDPDIVFKANPTQLSQLFINLIQNAQDACSASSKSDFVPKITISAQIQGETLLLTIEDNGIGMSEGIMDKIFDPFFTTKEVGSGMGLGLSICHAIVKFHSGRIEVKSTLGEGTTILVTLPAFHKPHNAKTTQNLEEPHESLI